MVISGYGIMVNGNGIKLIEEKRPVLFKAKRIDNGEWVIGYVTRIRRSDKKGNAKSYYFNALSEQGWVTECVVSAETVCQYTGLDDKKGNKIFEWDIVDCREKRGAAFWRCKVAWNKEKARFDVITMGCAFPLFLEDSNSGIRVGGADYEVVGNVFDNPELIGGEGNEERHD